ncbi:putative sporulation protein YtxC [Paratissierella segnis]|uniref:Sporulation protein YtxC n=1 Tax=Paratissierella segnis TaxID=2763679 RepID=A0A926EVZ5_9FIRM|nr:putative sporulation protein YtxC [Paratissierella segnis]MBC8589313.1 putative sporulation protein YtxC [Paratissierella segnis]
MVPIRISTNLPKDKVNELVLSHSLDGHISILNETNENETSSFIINKKKLDEMIFYNSITEMVFNLINRFYMDQFVFNRVNDILVDFIQNEIDVVSNTVYDLLQDNDYFTKEKNKIREELRDYLLENNTLNIDGYLRFRSDSYKELIDLIIEKVVLDIQMETEYEEFIYMLQYYLDSQFPKYDIVNVIINENNYYLVDSKHKKIESPILYSIIEEQGIDDFSQADILVSSLIVLAPKKIVVHMKNDKEKDLLMILKRIFTDRLSFCYSCNICDNYLPKSDSE